ncbi:MAG: quinolinate synthase NadA [Spirochaetes bacterium]|nr:quinolinate synthase NadA [Spirochaetota bacterium]
MSIIDTIRNLARAKDAIILAHNYQPPEIQDVADFVGDSLELARIASRHAAQMIVLCGVHFMAESAAILAPHKKVILPVLDAGCPMADMAHPDEVCELKRKHPDAMVITYINSTAAVKAVSDVCCTSSNAVRIVKAVPSQKVIFVPDKNLGKWVARHVEKEILLWEGFCPTHQLFTKSELLNAKRKHPDAVVMVHPECDPEVIDLADEILSTSGMVNFVKRTSAKKIIVGTEKEIIHRLKREAPHVEYILPSDKLVCPNMKKITLEKLFRALSDEEPAIAVEEQIRQQAFRCLEKMLELSN